MKSGVIRALTLSALSLAMQAQAIEPRPAIVYPCEPDPQVRCGTPTPLPTRTPRPTPRPTLPPPDDDVIVKQHLEQMAAPVLTIAQNPNVRQIVYNGVAARFDGDDNVLLSTVLDQAEAAGVVDPASPEWVQLRAEIAQLQDVHGQAYQPQIYIPNFEEGNLSWQSGNVTLAIVENDPRSPDVPAYELDADGGLRPLDFLIGEEYADEHEVWVLSVNERIDLDPVQYAHVRAVDAALESPDFSSQAMTSSLNCNPTGLRNNRGLEYLQRFRIMNLRSVEHWTAGKIEPRVVIVGKGGVEISNKYFGKIKRKHLRDQKWYTTDSFITTWDRAVWGDYLAFKWLEIDGGPKITIDLKLSATILKIINASAGVSAVFEKKYDDMGAGTVGFDESTYITYSTGILEWNECSIGGDGGTGDSNIARSATASASSSYSGYSPQRANDGSQSTALGGAYSWSNAHIYGPNGVLPQWLQLDFGTLKTFSKVEIYTTASYPISAYDVQYWDAGAGVWRTVVVVNNNTSAHVVHTFGAVTSRIVRIWCRRGPAIQPQHVRLNEVEVY
jgi:hypothetical protein